MRSSINNCLLSSVFCPKKALRKFQDLLRKFQHLDQELDDLEHGKSYCTYNMFDDIFKFCEKMRKKQSTEMF